MHDPRCHPRWSRCSRLPLRAYGPAKAHRYAAPDNGGDTGDVYLAGDSSPSRSGRSSRIHSTPAPALGSHPPQLALPCVPAPTRSDRGRSHSSTTQTLTTMARYCQAPRSAGVPVSVFGGASLPYRDWRQLARSKTLTGTPCTAPPLDTSAVTVHKFHAMAIVAPTRRRA
jgi:hypothetical protein